MLLLGTAKTGFRGSSFERRTNVQRAAEMFDGLVVAPGEEFSFIGNRDFSEAAGFVEGYAIIGGKLDRAIGGGLCQVSTTMFRAVAAAGLEILRRIPHTHVVYFYDNIPGFDATVYTPGIDFRWRNDSPSPVTIATMVDQRAATITFDIFGPGDGRKSTFLGPDVRNLVQPGKAVWQFDPALGAGQKSQLVHGRPGMDVTLVRLVTRGDGQRLRQDSFLTHYTPWADYWTYGPGVTPPADALVVKG
jgi:vancomycin resistance protein YoaR